MARIRSLHPGQATDEDFVEMSRDARLFALLLRCEADDQGLFEWKPRRLKMAIFPADDDVDIAALLSELVENRQIVEFEADGRRFGAIRNFRRWQRPKKPNAIHPLPNHLRTYVGFKEDEFPTGSEPAGGDVVEVRKGSSIGTENPIQRKEVGGRREEKEEPSGSSKEPAKPAAAKRGTRVDGFEPDIEWAVSEGLPLAKAKRAAQRFLNHWKGKAGKDATKVDWPATWRNWVWKDLDVSRPAGPEPTDHYGDLRDDPFFKRELAKSF